MNICTIIAKNYVAHARTLAESFTAHHPGGRCFALIIDDFDDTDIDSANEPFTVVRPTDIPLDTADFDDMRAMYSVVEFSTAVKPWLLQYMLDEHDDGSGVAYFDPDIRVYSRMEELEAALRETHVVLTPHLTEPMPRDGLRPAETDIMIAGIYNLGFIALTRGTDSQGLVDFWKERLRTDCWIAPERGLFVDQKWMDWVPGLYKNVTILRTPSYNVAYWNAMTRVVDGTAADGYTVDGLPLRFFHFSGYSPKHPTHLSKHQDRIPLTLGGPLRELCDGYRERLLANGVEQAGEWQYSHDLLPSGEKLSLFTRALYRRGMAEGVLTQGLFTPQGERDLIAWANEAEPGAPGLTRYLYELWRQRDDLQHAYPDVKHGDRDDFIGWCQVYGRDQVPIPERMLALTPPSEPLPAAAAPANPAPAAPQDDASPAAFGVNVVGYLRSELGVGEVARQLMGALDAAGVPSLPRVLSAPLSRQGHAFMEGAGGEYPFANNLLFVNADMLPEFAQGTEEFFAGRHTIGYWWWELQEFPDHLHGAFQYVDEIWVGSTFVADAINRHSTVPVIKMPVPVDVPIPPPLEPGELGWPQDRFTFLFSWDYNSVFARKNPLGVVEAFTQAFAPTDGAALVLKSINGEHHDDAHQQLLDAVDGRADILVMDDYVSARDKNRLTATCDAYVSLHRSEGLGLTMAEAMLMGKPVIATNYSGNTDFMTDANSYPVDYVLTEVGEGAAPYDPAAHWAEPDLAHAAALMRAVFDDPATARAKGARAATTIREQYSREAVGQAIKARLTVVTPTAPLRTARGDDLSWLISRGTTPRAPSRFGKPGAALRKLLLRTLRPYSAYQSDVNAGLLRRVRELERERTSDASTRAQSIAHLLSELRTQRRGHDHLTEAVSNETRVRRLETTGLREEALRQREIANTFERIAGELTAIPYMASDALSTFDDPEAGTVFGYRDAPAASLSDDAYREFEELFRGSEDFIRDRQRRYLPIVDGHTPVLDLGCGRGEFLDLMAEAGIPAVGIDSDAGMVKRCHDKGHTATLLGDALQYLEDCSDASLGVVFSAQVVEHLSPDVLRRLLEVAARKIKPGGLFIAETVNPHSISALKTFWVDITHQHPLFPESMVGFARIAGFSSAYVFHPNGSGDIERDRITTGEYALVAKV